jgi:acyl-CoA reductase-like NAD-dependent aldehyde dehydrogenase
VPKFLDDAEKEHLTALIGGKKHHGTAGYFIPPTSKGHLFNMTCDQFSSPRSLS